MVFEVVAHVPPPTLRSSGAISFDHYLRNARCKKSLLARKIGYLRGASVWGGGTSFRFGDELGYLATASFGPSVDATLTRFRGAESMPLQERADGNDRTLDQR
jgi:hypothetical protein